jgi:superfamily I DNA/RNA helicase
MNGSWNEGVRGSQVLPLINLDAKTIRVLAGPGTGKTFGLVRRVERILHPDGLAVDGHSVLVVAFNRVIARQLRDEIDERIKTFDHKNAPGIRTIHALCIDVIGENLRMLLPHEVEAMVYDVLHLHVPIAELYHDFYAAAQALRDHEAGHAEHLKLWKAAREWLERHQAHLVGDLPRLLLERLKGGDFSEQAYDFVIVDEFQDLTAGEQELMFRLRRSGGQLLALGDPRQSIYRFRGNDRQGLSKLEELVGADGKITDVPMTECQRCPKPIVIAANHLMSLSGTDEMVPISETAADLHVVTWKNPREEATGMAAAIVKNIHAHPTDRHLVMVTRRQFGYWLREEFAKLDATLRVELGFSEGLLESWAAREAFLMFCLLVDPDPPTWRAWLAYKNSTTGDNFTATKRNADAYLRLLTDAQDVITRAVIETLATESRTKPRGQGGATIWDRAHRFLDLSVELEWQGGDAVAFVNNLFSPDHWIGEPYKEEKRKSATLDLHLLREKTLALLEQQAKAHPEALPAQNLRAVAQRLRHQIATNEPLTSDEPADLQVATLWGAKGVTAEHVYILGVCGEAIPGQRRDDYPGTNADYAGEQRRLFYVSITRAKRTLVLSRALRIARGEASRIGLKVTGGKYWCNLKMSPFLHEIMSLLPAAVPGPDWEGCS